VVGFDGSDGSRRALEVAAQLMGYGSTLTVVNVEREQGGAGRGVLDGARQLLLGQLVSANYVRRRGDPADEIVEAAHELGADVIVVGRRGPAAGSGGAAPGSVSAAVVQRAHCHVFVAG
jgi:nucleotide-binding universal stress UspA family protein